MERVLVSWSSGKDCALALYDLLNDPSYEVTALLTTVAESSGRVSMHNVRMGLLQEQAASLAIPLEIVPFSPGEPAETYAARMRQVLARYQRQGVTGVAFGDIFLEDLKESREAKLAQLGLQGVFPLWKQDTRKLACRLVDLGFQAVVTSVDTSFLDKGFIGRAIDDQFLAALPPGVDPCGENGEYHSFVFDGPIFRTRIRFALGEITSYEERYLYLDLLPDKQEPCGGL